MTATTMNISLPDSMKEFVEAQLRAGSYSSASEYVRELIRKEQLAKAEAKLRDMILEGINSGPAVLVDENFFTDLKAKIKARRIPA
jgi:antitoxin ParD1/3/4